MAKAKVTFKPVRIAEGEWNIVAERPGIGPVEIGGFKSKAEIDEWMNGERRIARPLGGVRQVRFAAEDRHPWGVPVASPAARLTV